MRLRECSNSVLFAIYSVRLLFMCVTYLWRHQCQYKFSSKSFGTSSLFFSALARRMKFSAICGFWVLTYLCACVSCLSLPVSLVTLLGTFCKNHVNLIIAQRVLTFHCVHSLQVPSLNFHCVHSLQVSETCVCVCVCVSVVFGTLCARATERSGYRWNPRQSGPRMPFRVGMRFWSCPSFHLGYNSKPKEPNPADLVEGSAFSLCTFSDQKWA